MADLRGGSSSRCSDARNENENKNPSTNLQTPSAGHIGGIRNAFTIFISSILSLLCRMLKFFGFSNSINHVSDIDQSVEGSTAATSSGLSGRSDQRKRDAFDGIAPVPESCAQYICDVFINHRGKDVKKTLASTLYHTLQIMGLRVFLDLEELELGDNLPTKIREAMRTASVHIAIFSKNYAQSPWCLAELCFMLETGAKIIPVFYHVDPSDLRYMKRDYAQAFAEHERKGRYKPEMISQWKEALYRASFLSGCELNDLNDDQGRLLKNIVNTVSREVKIVPLEVAKHPVGLEQAFRDFENKMSERRQLHPDETVKIVGIVGMGGIGKTTLAKELYNRKRSSFNGSSFLFDVREAWARNSLETLQIKLLKDLVNFDAKFHSTSEGKEVLRYRLNLSSSPYLIVLDDIDHVDQLDALLVKDALRSDSLIIVTSRDKGVLIRSGITLLHEVKGLDAEHAEQLFCWHAFLQPTPARGFEELVKSFLIACNGLPLSLKVFGGFLYGCKDRRYWKSQLEKISRILPDDIKQRLKVTYDALDREERQIFLDIACFFRGEDKNLTTRIWDGSGWNGLHSLQTLEYKCLVDIDEFNRLTMHDHLRDLGRDIADEYSVSSDLPCRLWRKDDVSNILARRKERMEVRGIIAASREFRLGFGRGCSSYYQPPFEEIQQLAELDPRWRIFGGSVGLKLLAIRGDYLRNEFSRLLKDLVWLRWFDCPHLSIPSWIELRNLQALELIGGNFEEPWQGNAAQQQPPLRLRELNITCGQLGSFPKSIGLLKGLEKIELRGSLGENLPEEFCDLQSLQHLELHCVEGLTSLPGRFGELTNLEHINLSDCYKLETLPNTFNEFPQLRYLDLTRCSSLKIQPDILQKITTLEYLCFEGCKKADVLPRQITRQLSLRMLNLLGTSLHELPFELGNLRNLEVLKIGSPFLTCLPHSFGNLRRLTHLELQNCEKIKCLHESVTSSTQSEINPSAGLVGQLVNLETLTIASCPIGELKLGVAVASNHLNSDSIRCRLARLKYLTLVKTNLSRISISDNDCPSLETLDLSYNEFLLELETLPTTLADLNLRSCSGLKGMPGNCQLRNLRRLDMRDCFEIQELSLAHMSSLKILNVNKCRQLRSIKGVANMSLLEKLEADSCWNLGSIEGLDHAERLTYLKLSSAIRTIWKSIQQLQRLPCNMILSGRAAGCVQSTLKSLDCPDLTVVDCPVVRWYDGLHYWALEMPLTEVNSLSAVLICFVINSTSILREFTVDVFPGEHDNHPSFVNIRKGKWICMSIFTQGSSFMEDVKKSRQKAVIVRKTLRNRVTYGWMAMASEGKESKILEVFSKLLTVYNESRRYGRSVALRI